MLKTTPAITIEQYENEISNNYERRMFAGARALFRAAGVG